MIDWFRHPTAGSFVRLQKVDFGRSCVSAIRERYADNQLAVAAEELQELQRAMNAPSLELVGFEKVNKQQRWEYSNCLVIFIVTNSFKGLNGVGLFLQSENWTRNTLSCLIWEVFWEIIVLFWSLLKAQTNENNWFLTEVLGILLSCCWSDLSQQFQESFVQTPLVTKARVKNLVLSFENISSISQAPNLGKNLAI